jgi:hypothetical protein
MPFVVSLKIVKIVIVINGFLQNSKTCPYVSGVLLSINIVPCRKQNICHYFSKDCMDSLVLMYVACDY